jgi:hypothetical protein
MTRRKTIEFTDKAKKLLGARSKLFRVTLTHPHAPLTPGGYAATHVEGGWPEARYTKQSS